MKNNMKKGLIASILFLTIFALTACLPESSDDQSSSSSQQASSGNSSSGESLQQAQFVLKEFSFAQGKTEASALFQFLSLESNKMTEGSILRDGRRLEVTIKDANKDVIPCGSHESNCTDGVRTFTEEELVQEGFSISSNTTYVEYIQMEIYSAEDLLLYKTNQDLPINNDKGEVIARSFNFYPNQSVTMSTNVLKKTLGVSLALSDISNELVGYADSQGVKGELTCAEENQNPYNDFPITIDFTHDSDGKSIQSATFDLNDLYVGSPCELTLTGTKNSEKIFEGAVEFSIEDDEEQEVSETLHLDTMIGQTLLVFVAGDASDDFHIKVNNTALNSSIKEYFNRDVPLVYTLRIEDDSSDQTITLDSEDGGNTLTKSIPFPYDREVTVTFSVYKDNENSVWLANSQTVTVTEDNPSIPAFTLQLNKKLNFGVVRTMGKASIRVINEDTNEPVVGATVTFRTNNSATDITETTDENGFASRLSFGKGLVHGVYTVDIAKEGFPTHQTTFELAENGIVSKTVKFSNSFNYFSESSILQAHAEENQLNTWAQTSDQKWEQCYQKSDGDLDVMMSKCGAKNATLVLVKLDNGKRIGGYASVAWNTDEGYFGNNQSFLFSLSTVHKYSHYQNTHYLYRPSNNSNIGWGGGHDFNIDKNVTDGYTNLGYAYQCNTGSYGSDECRNEFAGAHNGWQIVKMEVFYKAP